MQLDTRVVILRDADEKTIFIYGYGTYQGEVEDETFTALDAKTKEEVLGMLKSLGRGVPMVPKLVRDDGTVIYGNQCHWGEQEQFEQWIHDRTIEVVPFEIPSDKEEFTDEN